MNNKSGFISMTLVYTFLILFLFIMLAILSCYGDKNKFLGLINEKINNDISFSSRNTLIKKMYEDNEVTLYDADNSQSDGLYYVYENYNRYIYFYRGNVENNYVVFGKDNNEGSSFCWRIVRTNEEDGSIRLIYNGVVSDGSCNNSNNFVTVDSANLFKFNGSQKNDNAYVGFTYGATDNSDFNETHYGSNNSVLKNKLEAWFNTKTNLKKYMNTSIEGTELFSEEKRYLVDAVFCADRTKNESEHGTKTNLTNYGLKSRTTPSLACNSYDSYSLTVLRFGKDEKLSALNFPVGLLTADEAMLAGVGTNESSDCYLKASNLEGYWTMSPAAYTSLGAKVYYISNDGKLNEGYVDNDKGLRPVISISSESIVEKGNGSISNPYKVG